MKFAICNETFQNQDWAETCRLVAAEGYDGIEIAPFTLTEDIRTLPSSSRGAIRETARQYGLEIVGLHWLLVSPKGLSLTSPDNALRTETAAYLAAQVDFCADLGGKILVLGSPQQRRIAPDDDTTLATDRLISSLEPALQRCLMHQVTLCLEPLPAPEADLILTLQEAVSVAARLNHPQLKTILDIKSASSELKPIPELIVEYQSLIAHCHANDVNRRGPGFGNTNFIPILQALEQVGYNGYVSVEVFDYTPDPITIAHNSLTYLRQCLESIRQA